MYYFIEHARNDSVITLDELKNFGTLMIEYRTNVDFMDKDNELNIENMFSEKEKKKLHDKAHNETKEVLKKQLKEEYIKNQLSQYHVASSIPQKEK